MTTPDGYAHKVLLSIGSERNEWLHHTAKERGCTIAELACLILDQWRAGEIKTLLETPRTPSNREGLEDLDRGLTVAAAHLNMALWGLLEPSLDDDEITYNLKQAVTSIAKLQYDLIDP